MALTKAIYEHLITKKKYNTLELKLIAVRDELEKKIIELNVERKQNNLKKEMWEKIIKDQEREIIRLKKLNKKKKETK